MDELIKTVVTGAPNLIVALWFIIWLTRRLESRDELLLKMVERCFEEKTEDATEE